MNKVERIKLRSLAQNLPDLVYIGKDGITENVVNQINKNLFAHELIKIKVLNNCDFLASEVGKQLEEICGCEIVTTIGNKIVIYKFSSKEKIKHVL